MHEYVSVQVCADATCGVRGRVAGVAAACVSSRAPMVLSRSLSLFIARVRMCCQAALRAAIRAAGAVELARAAARHGGDAKAKAERLLAALQ